MINAPHLFPDRCFPQPHEANLAADTHAEAHSCVEIFMSAVIQVHQLTLKYNKHIYI